MERRKKERKAGRQAASPLNRQGRNLLNRKHGDGIFINTGQGAVGFELRVGHCHINLHVGVKDRPLVGCELGVERDHEKKKKE